MNVMMSLCEEHALCHVQYVCVRLSSANLVY